MNQEQGINILHIRTIWWNYLHYLNLCNK